MSSGEAWAACALSPCHSWWNQFWLLWPDFFFVLTPFLGWRSREEQQCFIPMDQSLNFSSLPMGKGLRGVAGLSDIRSVVRGNEPGLPGSSGALEEALIEPHLARQPTFFFDSFPPSQQVFLLPSFHTHPT